MSDSPQPPMTSPTPYLLRGLFEWICDNGMSPYLRVVVNSEDVMVPEQYVEHGVIVLNISPSAVRALDIGDEAVCFSARFSGSPFEVYVPIGSVQAIYARETGQGLVFFEDEAAASERSRPCAETEAEPDENSSRPDRPRGKPDLKLVD